MILVQKVVAVFVPGLKTIARLVWFSVIGTYLTFNLSDLGKYQGFSSLTRKICSEKLPSNRTVGQKTKKQNRYDFLNKHHMYESNFGIQRKKFWNNPELETPDPDRRSVFESSFTIKVIFTWHKVRNFQSDFEAHTHVPHSVVFVLNRPGLVQESSDRNTFVKTWARCYQKATLQIPPLFFTFEIFQSEIF